jgi:hypothetical protein
MVLAEEENGAFQFPGEKSISELGIQSLQMRWCELNTYPELPHSSSSFLLNARRGSWRWVKKMRRLCNTGLGNCERVEESLSQLVCEYPKRFHEQFI